MNNNSNIASVPFTISKMRVFYNEGNRTKRLTANMKYHPDEGYLISARSVAGIEVARILFADDTLRVLDRINRIYYKSTTKNIVDRFGIRPEEICIMVGYISGEIGNGKIGEKCIDTIAFDKNVHSGRGQYLLACEGLEVILYRYSDSSDTGELIMDYSRYRSVDRYRYPETIVLTNRLRNINIRIEIDRMDLLDEYSVKFNINDTYERKRL